MGFKKMSRSLDFADFALSSSLEANRSVKFTPLNIPGTSRFRWRVITDCFGPAILCETINGI